MKLRNSYYRKILKEAIQEKRYTVKELKTQLREQEQLISTRTSWLKNIALKYSTKRPMDRKILEASDLHNQNFLIFLRERNISTGITKNPNEIITNLTGDTITSEQDSILQFGLKHNLATRPKESDITATAESIWDQLKRENLLPDGYITQQKVKHSINALACNFVDFDHKQLHQDHKRIKILMDLNNKHPILKSDKGSGVVLLKQVDYRNCMTELFADPF